MLTGGKKQVLAKSVPVQPGGSMGSHRQSRNASRPSRIDRFCLVARSSSSADANPTSHPAGRAPTLRGLAFCRRCSIIISEGIELVLFARERACEINRGRYWRTGRLPYKNTENGGTRGPPVALGSFMSAGGPLPQSALGALAHAT